VRQENFDEDFTQHGAASERRQVIPGRSWAAWARALGHLLPPLEIADLGCGEGYLTIEAARFAKRVIAVDRSEAMLTRAKNLAAKRFELAQSGALTSRANAVSEPRERSEPAKRRARERAGEFEGRSPSMRANVVSEPRERSEPATRRARERVGEFEGRSPSTRIEWKRGEIEHLPIEDASVDVAILSQALHHAASPAKALAEAARIVRPGGRVLILDLRRHDEHWVRERLGDKWLGFEDAELAQLVKGAGLTDVQVTVGARRARDPFTVIIASGRKPAAASPSKKDRRHAR